MAGAMLVLVVAGVAPGFGCAAAVNGDRDLGAGGEVDLGSDIDLSGNVELGPGGSDGSAPDMAGEACGLVTCASLNASCGPIGDGCGGTLSCGNCAPPQTCGGGTTLFECGRACTPKTCSDLGYNCGPAGDGCGGTLDCGTCSMPQTCGGGPLPGRCGSGGTGDGGTCTPRTCADANANCGYITDGCNNLIPCGSCGDMAVCGAGGPNRCGGVSACTPRTCAQLGFNCGTVGDGCGNTMTCGTLGGGCPSGEVCGGGVGGNGQPNVCSGSSTGTTTCTGGAVTKISGTAVAGTDPARGFGNPDPLYGATVFVPSGSLQPITTGVTCDQCGNPQPVRVSTVTGIDGKFVLTNPPTGPNVTVVVQLGKWRRVATVNVTPCVDNVLTQEQTRMPRNRNEGNIPRFAVSTGGVDVLECMLRKMGIEDSEFTAPVLSGTTPTALGRVHVYQGGYQATGMNTGGAIAASGTTPRENLLWGNQATLNAYDAILFPCEGGAVDHDTADPRIVSYANAGGRLFTTHYSYIWLYDSAFSSTASTWATRLLAANQTGLIDRSFPKGEALAQWLELINPSGTLGQIPVNEVRSDFYAVNNPPAQRWLSANVGGTSVPLHYTFNTPINVTAANQCGRVVFSDFHVTNHAGANGLRFPMECSGGAMTPQEKLLEFMLFDLTSCVAPDVPQPPTCTPLTCPQIPATCGTQGDGCGGTLDCGVCARPATCGGGGTPNQCGGSDPCTRITCADQNIACGPASDGCGGTYTNCGPCPPDQTCGGGGVPGQCGSTTSCNPRTCPQQGIQCGPAGDGCGNLIQCGTCTPPETCGGGGIPGQCGGCTPRTCQQAGADCGPIGDGCGGVVDCGTCTPPDACGGGSVAHQCGRLG